MTTSSFAPRMDFTVGTIYRQAIVTLVSAAFLLVCTETGTKISEIVVFSYQINK